jgi:sterol desaturase/sphingolipid hydroxylase (fatty acid hydroxylase superfamily)
MLAMLEPMIDALARFGQGVLNMIPWIAAVGLAFTVLGFFTRSQASKGPWWRKPDLITDILYGFLVPGFMGYVKLAILVAGASLMVSLFGTGDIQGWMEGGYGPFAALPFWAQCVVSLLLADVMLYWTHRIFHDDKLWRYHAIHHSSEHLDWISAFRFHPINTIFHTVIVDVILLLAGIPPAVFIFLLPAQVFMSGLVHADVDWDFGPFKYVIASPVFHRWHHTDVARGGSMNYAPTFPVIDMIFGTFYMPEGKLPDDFGVDDPDFPKAFEKQLLYPFQSGGKAG